MIHQYFPSRTKKPKCSNHPDSVVLQHQNFYHQHPNSDISNSANNRKRVYPSTPLPNEGYSKKVCVAPSKLPLKNIKVESITSESELSNNSSSMSESPVGTFERASTQKLQQRKIVRVSQTQFMNSASDRKSEKLTRRSESRTSSSSSMSISWTQSPHDSLSSNSSIEPTCSYQSKFLLHNNQSHVQEKIPVHQYQVCRTKTRSYQKNQSNSGFHDKNPRSCNEPILHSQEHQKQQVDQSRQTQQTQQTQKQEESKQKPHVCQKQLRAVDDQVSKLLLALVVGVPFPNNSIPPLHITSSDHELTNMINELSILRTNLEKLSDFCTPSAVSDNAIESTKKKESTLLTSTEYSNDACHMQYCDAFIRHGGILIIVGLMKRYPHNSHVQVLCCRLLSLVALNSSNPRDVSLLAVRIGAVDCALAAVLNFIPNSDLTNKNLPATSTTLSTFPGGECDNGQNGGFRKGIHVANKNGVGEALLVNYAASYCLIVLCQYINLSSWIMQRKQEQNCISIESSHPKANVRNHDNPNNYIYWIVRTIISFTDLVQTDASIVKNACQAIENLLFQNYDDNEKDSSESNHYGKECDSSRDLCSSIVLVVQDAVKLSAGMVLLSNIIVKHTNDKVIQKSAKNIMFALLQ